MSGGHFDYQQYRLHDIASMIDELIAGNEQPDCFGYARNYSPETIAKFKLASEALERAGAMAQRIDWLVSGDDGEETFHARWKEEVDDES
jgi:hypothetical protein